jgi:heme exporter protein D
MLVAAATKGCAGPCDEGSVLVDEELHRGLLVGAALLGGLSIESLHERRAHLVEVRARRDGHEVLPAHSLSPRLDATFVMAGVRSREARLERVVRDERREARRQRTHSADEDATYGEPQVVVRDALRDATEVLECAHVPIEKAVLVLVLVEPREVAPRVHEPHHEEPCSMSLPVEVDPHLEEGDLRELARPIRQRHEDFSSLPFPLGHQLLDHRLADDVALFSQELPESARREPLLPLRPRR